MENVAETVAVTREITIDASPETVWAYLVEPEKLTRWMGLSAQVGSAPGEIYRCVVNPTHTAIGEIVELDPPNRFVFTWGWEEVPGREVTVAPGSSTVEITLEPRGDTTLLRLHHFDLPTSLGDGHGRGWDHYLARLLVTAPGGDPGRDEWLQN